MNVLVNEKLEQINLTYYAVSEGIFSPFVNTEEGVIPLNDFRHIYSFSFKLLMVT